MRSVGGTASRPVDEALLASILSPYKPHCRYLKTAAVERAPAGEVLDSEWNDFVRIEGELGIAASCYIEDTGHFNSVEFNICFNQLMYVLFAQCVVDGIHPAFASMTLEEYKRRQLPDVLIHDFSSVFRRVVDARAFRGRMGITEVRDRGKFKLFKTRCSFWDAQDGFAEGAVSLVIVDRPEDAPLREFMRS